MPPIIEGNTSSNESSKGHCGTILLELRGRNPPEFRGTHPPIIPPYGIEHIFPREGTVAPKMCVHISSTECLKGDGDTIFSEFRCTNPPVTLGIVGVRRGVAKNVLAFRDTTANK